MKIQIENFLIEMDSISGFNLYRKSITQSGKNIGKETLINEGYNMSLRRCINKIAHYNLSNKDLLVSMNEFVKAYSSEVTRLELLANEIS